jgi:DNA-binding response OmpR family regulator
MDVVVYAPDACERAVLATVAQQADARAIFTSAEAIIEHWADYATDAVLLALHCEPTNLIRHVRAVAGVPLIIITDPLTEVQQAALYDAGASLVLPRPYSAAAGCPTARPAPVGRRDGRRCRPPG